MKHRAPIDRNPPVVACLPFQVWFVNSLGGIIEVGNWNLRRGDLVADPNDMAGHTSETSGVGASEGANCRDLIEGYLAEFPSLRKNIVRQLLLSLHARGHVTVDHIYKEARASIQKAAGEPVGDPPPPTTPSPSNDDADEDAEGSDEDPDPNKGIAHLWNAGEKELIEKLTLEYACHHLTAGEIDSLVILARKRAEAQTLEVIANMPEVPFELLSRKLDEYCALPGKWVRLPREEAVGIRVPLIRRFISEQLDLIGVAKKHIRVRDFNPLMQNSIGPKDGAGKLGGKAAGMILAQCVLRDAAEETEKPMGPFVMPESIFLRTDLIIEFLQLNGLFDVFEQKYKDIDEIRGEYPAIREVFKNAEFPPHAVERLRGELERIGPHPLIVRSSSLLEDNFHYAFSGKYSSIFLGNQGSLDDRLTELLGAIAEVYASTLGPDPIIYRRARGLLDYDEQMGAIIQKVVGRQHGRYFLPHWAGVAFSHNEFRWNRRIKEEDGLVRLVMGLGSRAVDRVGSDYPRMVPLGVPTLRPEANAEAICRYSQRYVDVIDLKENTFTSVPLSAILAEGPYPDLDKIVSVYREGDLSAPLTKRIDSPPQNLIVTFEKLLGATDFTRRLRWTLEKLEAAYGRSVDVEFAFDGEQFYVLQCRPLSRRAERMRVGVPDNVPADRKVFSANRDVPTAQIEDVEYIVYVDPTEYDRLDSSRARHRVGNVVGAVNRGLAEKRFILMGPGRWGSSDVRLGVRVTYSDICNTRLLVEIARERGGYVPEVSFGTHFFQDLVESEIYHLPVYPDSPKVVFNDDLLLNAPNSLGEVVPQHADRPGPVRVIHIPSIAGGNCLRVVMDGEEDEALAYLT